MGTHSRFWQFACKLASILFLFISLSEGASECQVFQGCSCNIVLNDRGVELGNSYDCSSKKLTDVPTPNLSDNKSIYELRLNNNNINSLGENILSGLIVTKLDLSDNPISSVHKNTFGNLGSTLKILILSGNSTSRPPKNAFTSLNQLEELTLKNYEVPFLFENDTYFISFTKLRYLTLDNWKLVAIDTFSFRLSSSNYLLLNLTLLNQPMEVLPLPALLGNDLSGLQKLQISGTLIPTVVSRIFSALKNIKEIDLSGNHITSLESDCFSGIENILVRLSLSNNSLTQDATNLSGLKNLASLQELDLSFNKMTEVASLSQLGTNKSLNLFLKKNTITSLKENSFVGIADKLRVLDLSQNEIGNIHGNSFIGATTLEALYLSRQSSNNPLILPPSITQAARTLKQLYVDGQEISTSELWSVIWQLPMLEMLNLSSTKLEVIPNMSLFNLTNLKSLDLSYNRLNNITQATLAGPRGLKFLFLTGNAIKSLSSCVFYQYTSYPISLAMGMNPLTCDCAVKWLLNRINNGSVTFIPGQEAICSDDNKPLASKKIECNPPVTDPQCSELYSAASKLPITLKFINYSSVHVSWQLSDTRDLKYFNITVTNTHSPLPVFEQSFGASIASYIVNNLLDKVQYFFCVTAFFNTHPAISTCAHTALSPSRTSPTDVTERTTGPDQGEIGIIIGAVVGAIVLLAILAAIGYLIIFRRKRKEKAPGNVPVQPRNFSKSELPSMNEETRTFSKPRKPRGTGASEHREGMQVVAISDGQTGNLRVGRAHMLNSDGSFKTSNSSKPSSTSSYENDHGPLPSIPGRPPSTHLPAAYYNMGYRDDKYDEIGNGKESVL